MADCRKIPEHKIVVQSRLDTSSDRINAILPLQKLSEAHLDQATRLK